ncbi:branched-chain amino acid ABC transporter permease [Pseudorhodoplanes sp.]|jgi:branched-chain amino acid transport system permease protein|uniref:branched-chain amino acid ABC transporter permease n=1 Tax=Pseudorhodoplanes sp. TaxID=1934341 RepID=UPI003D114481
MSSRVVWPSWKKAVAAAALAFVLLYIVPFKAPGYLVSQYATVLAFGIAIIGLNLVTGFGGAITLGHGAFVALGAYTTSILVVRYGWHPIATIPASAALGWLAGLLFGFPALRLHGLYLALGTLVLSITVPPVLKRLDGFTGGVQGLNVGNPAPPAWLAIDDTQWIYFVSLVCAGVLYFVARRIVDGALGRSLIATRDNMLVAAVMGISRVRLTTITFAVSSLYAGVAGSLYALIVGFVAPDSFTVMLSLSLFIAAVVGGVTSLGGAFLGALFIQFVPVWAGDIDPALAGLVYGIALILTLVIIPDGIGGFIKRWFVRLLVNRVERIRPDESR